jgi:hypothetical protein
MKRIFRWLLFASLFLAVTTLATASGRREPRDVSPDQLQQEVSGREVTVMLKDGRYFKGKVGEVSGQAIRVKVIRSHFTKDFPAGSEREVRFAELGVVSYIKHQGKARWLFPVIVGGTGALLTAAAHSYCENSNPCPETVGWMAGVTAGTTAAAAYGGYRMDRVEVQLRVRLSSE